MQCADDSVLWSIDARGVARVTLNRPEVNNAYNGTVIQGLHNAIDALGCRPELRAVIIAGSGRHFQAGADLKWLNALRAASPDENERASHLTAAVVDRLNRLPAPTVALVQGYCIGGGAGLVAACDIAIAAEDAVFAISEVRWGLTAAIVIPQLNDAIGVRQVRRYALTGERFNAIEARRIGLVHDVVPAAALETAGERIVAALLANGPQAMAETKAVVLEDAFGNIDGGRMARLIACHAAKRQSVEAAEGLASFVEKRAARWASDKERRS
jgi:methylglutaconyl-CoA hydratase